MKRQIPYLPQETNYTCGAASLRMILGAFGIKRGEKVLARQLGINKVSGAKTDAFEPVLKKYGLRYIIGENATLKDLKDLLTDGYLIMIGYFDEEYEIGHFAVLKKITKRFVYLVDPYIDLGDNHKLETPLFRKLWKLGFKYDKESSWFLGVKK